MSPVKQLVHAPVAGYSLTVCCPKCGGTVEHVAGGVVVAQTETRAICRCSVCGWRWMLEVFLRPAPDGNEMRNTRRVGGLTARERQERDVA